MEGFCRGCLGLYEGYDLLQYTEKNRRLFIYCTGLQVKRNDAFTFQLCKKCFSNMKQFCKFKKQCRNSDRKFKNNYLLGNNGDTFENPSKNIENSLSRLTGHSTPAYQNKDDDNESTCTSIRNFMGDILSCEEMPASEARIVRELIEEQADVLDESLDDCWLDDSSADEFDINLSITPFATPRSVKNDYCYTPRSMSDEKRREINYLTSKEIIEKLDKPEISRKYDMPLLDDTEYTNVMPIEDVKMKSAKGKKGAINQKPTLELPDLDNSIPSEVEDMVTENSISSTFKHFKSSLLADLAVKKELGILETDSNLDVFDGVTVDLKTKENELCVVLNQGKAKVSTPLINELEFYVNKAELKRNISTTDNKEYHCTIDRNLEIALKSKASKEVALDQLITSPAVSLRSGMSTPTIKNILFGDKNTKTVANSVLSTPTVNNILFDKEISSKTHKYFPQVGQDIDDNYMLGDILSGNDTNVELIKTSNGCEQSLKGKNKMENNDHLDVLEEFLRNADASPMNDSIQLDIIDPVDQSDDSLFKLPMVLHDKYDLENSLCKICNKKFTSPKTLKNHFAKTHNYKIPSNDTHGNKAQNAKSKVCDICGTTVKGAANFCRHMKRHQEKNGDFFQCDHCTLFFNTKLALRLHIYMHMNKKKEQKKFECHICGKLSSRSSNLKSHLRRHSEDKSHTCDICHKGFYTGYELKLHMRAHIHEFPFACQHCKSVFKRRGSLNLHMKRHLGKLDFRCEVCNKEFVTKTLLASHYSSQRCITNREKASKPNYIPSIRYGKGSIENIKKMMRNSSTDMVKASDLESESKNSMTESPVTILNDNNNSAAEIGENKKI